MPCIVTLHSSEDSLKIHITPTLQRRETKRLSHASRKKLSGRGQGMVFCKNRGVGEREVDERGAGGGRNIGKLRNNA